MIPDWLPSPSVVRGVRIAAGSLRTLRSILARPLRLRRGRSRLAQLHGSPPPRSVLFLCQGNLYRSPYAMAVFRASLPAPLRDSVRVASAGFFGSGRAVPSPAMALAAARGFDLRGHRSTLVSSDAITTADLVVVMEPAQERALLRRYENRITQVLVLGDLDPEGSTPRAIEDPALQSLDRLEQCFARIERCTTVLGRAVAFSVAGAPDDR